MRSPAGNRKPRVSLVWRFWGSEEGRAGVGGFVVSLGRARRFSENTASHVCPSADSKSRSASECFRAALPAPLLTWRGDTPRTRGGGTTQEPDGVAQKPSSTEKQTSTRSRSRHADPRDPACAEHAHTCATTELAHGM